MKKPLLLLIILLASLFVQAQIINVENARLHSDTSGWMGGAGASVNLNKNAVRVFAFNLESHLQYKTPNEKNLWLIFGNYSFLKAGADKLVSQGFLHLRYNYKVGPVLRWEVFGQYQNNRVLQLDHRFLLGTGPRFRVLKTKKGRLYSGCLLMLENERELTQPPVTHTDFRNSSYISLSLVPNQQVELVSTFFYQPLLKEFADYRLLNQSSVKVKTGKRLAISLNLNYLHDSRPAGTSPSTTYNFSTGLDYDF